MTSGATPPNSPTRRRFIGACAAGLSALGGLLSGCADLLRPALPARERFACAAGDDDAFDYIVVGSGAGGGPLAANLARTGFRVLLLEAGGDEDSYDYQVPAFHARASEDPRYAWNFFVRHYADDDRQRRDDKFRPEQGGVLYPRAATLGGCTAHNAMILVYPHNSDWDGIAELTGDDSWRAETMRRYFERLERCEYDDRDPAARHGYRGWLTTNVVDPKIALKDAFVLRLVKGAVRESLRTLGNPITRLFGKLRTDLDPNDWRTVKDDVEGVCMTPLTTDRGRRVGSREYVQAVAAACPGNLVVRTHTLVTRVLLDDDNRATGVECLAGAHLYRADPGADSGDDSEPVRFNARREVILCAGAFNTPQLLKLSGIGPRAELERHGIPLRVDLPGVGENLQDRYEVTVVNRMRGNFLLMQDMQYRPPAPGEEPDPQFREWLDGKGPYTSNGAVVALLKRSTADKPEPDLFLFGLLGSFRGYYPGYSRDIAQGEDHFTWAVLKAHTHNRAGCVRLRSADPRDVPDIDFHYFNEGTDGGDDLAAVVEGVETVRRMADRAGDVIAEEIYPGREVADRAAVEAFIRDNAWGHHASCSCRMGPAGDAMAVVDSRFRVFGCSGLRVVDASVFPRIPGFFIVSAVYMISEKAADVIVEDAGVAARADA